MYVVCGRCGVVCVCGGCMQCGMGVVRCIVCFVCVYVCRYVVSVCVGWGGVGGGGGG